MFILLSAGVLNLIKSPPTDITIIIYIVSTCVVIPAHFLTRSGNHIQSVSLIVLMMSWIVATIINIFFQQVAISSYISLTIMTFLLVHVPAGFLAFVINIITISCLFLFRDSFPVLVQTDRDIFFIVLSLGNLSIIYGIVYFIITESIRIKNKYQQSIQDLNQQAQFQYDKLAKEYENVLNTISEAVIITDMQLTIITWNTAAQRIYGHSREQTIGKKLTDIIPTIFSSDENQTTMRQRYVEGGLWQNEVIQKRQDETYLYALSSMSLLYDPHDKPIGAITVNQEISDYVHAEREIYRLNKDILTLEELRQDILTLVSDDIRKQLNTLRSQGQVIAHKINDEAITDKTRQTLNLIDQLASAIVMINDIHRQVKAGQPIKLDISPLVEASYNSYIEVAKKKNVKLSLIIEDHMLPMIIKADQNLLVKAINHLINNAIYFTPSGGIVEIRLFVNNNQIHFLVNDTGMGLSPLHQQGIFQPYFNYRANYTENSSIGLSIYTVKTIITYYNGMPLFDSEYGKGSSFGFALPHIVAPIL